LLAVTDGNYMPGTDINDLTVVKAILQDDVPLERLLIGLRRAVDRRFDPRAAPIASWRDERFCGRSRAALCSKVCSLGWWRDGRQQERRRRSPQSVLSPRPLSEYLPSRKTHQCSVGRRLRLSRRGRSLHQPKRTC